ncbi:MAG TPA: Gfo/Idh/MocA family oxidoreductase [Bryobacteraceae bacterium]|jgi:predicted dehydrogenase|nr:Gfo/Idh/MocA family oxidoreductase [Bryobacteraceae bacterium]
MAKIRAAVVGCGQFGKNHCRVVHESERADLVAVVDTDAARAAEAATTTGAASYRDFHALAGRVDAAVVAAPTSFHEEIGCCLLEAGIDVLVEKPIAPDLAAAKRLDDAAERAGRVLQVGHLERFNPAVIELERRATLPLFFEIHRLNVFSPRSLDVDVVLDLMIHDVDIVLSLTDAEPSEIRAAGISILSAKVDIANVRLQFPNGCVANLTASRVSTERVRKLRLFQPKQYLSLDYGRQDLAIFSVAGGQIGFEQAPVSKAEPLKLQFDAFLDSVETRKSPKTSARAARQSLGAALGILDKIKEHSGVVSQTLATGWKP